MGAQLEAALRQAKTHGKQGRTFEAEIIYQDILRRFPGNVRARKALTGLQATPGGQTDPKAMFAEALRLQRSGNAQAALEIYAKLLAVAPDHADTLNNLGVLLTNTGETEAAIAACQRAIAAQPDLARAHNNLGVAYRKSGDIVAAMSAFSKALDLDPDSPEVLNNLGTALKSVGHAGPAADCLKRALVLRPGYADCAKNLSMLVDGDDRTILADHIQTIHAAAGAQSDDRMLTAYALAELARKDQDPDTALHYLDEAGRIGKALSAYDSKRDSDLFNDIKTTCDTPLASVASDDLDVTPVFITGMPRSGTTLVEQILASHGHVNGAGELHLLTHLIEREGGPMEAGKPEALARIRDAYRQGIAHHAQGARFVTDKMPLNFRWIGHIRAAFPEARIIHMARPAEAVCWSNYRLHFPAPGMAFTYDQRDIAHYHRLHDDLMDFWDARFGAAIYRQSYITLTEDQAGQTRALSDWLGLPWDPAMLDFHKTGRPVDTASALQVRKEIYQGSSEDWRAYAHGLDPMLNALSDPQ